MNRLIIIGNGFDLAHRMKTSYNDFIKSYLKDCFYIANLERKYEDALISIQAEKGTPIIYVINQPRPMDNFIEYFYKNNELTNFLLGHNVMISDNEVLYNPFQIIVKSDFFFKLCTNCTQSTWVEIENEYYNELIKIFTSKNDNDGNELKTLNSSMSEIVVQMKKYLSMQEAEDIALNFRDILNAEIDITDFPKGNSINPIEAHLENTMVLNFNYTDTFELYLNQLSDKVCQTTEVNYIHGQLNDPDNPIIFGFGDEFDSYYNEIEKSKNKSYLEYIKSFWYFKTQNYHQLIKFVDSKKFQVYILGHSCGLSDRTMLKTIFEHDNCAAIKIYYYQNGKSNNYTNLTYEIARHFGDKIKMRERITPFPKCIAMPQLDPSVKSGYHLNKKTIKTPSPTPSNRQQSIPHRIQPSTSPTSSSSQ